MKLTHKSQVKSRLPKQPSELKSGIARSLLKMISFTPCSASNSLLEADRMAAKNALSENVILLSPGRFGLDQFRKQPHGEEVFTVLENCLATPSCGGWSAHRPNMQIANVGGSEHHEIFFNNLAAFAPGFYEEKPRREKNINQTITLTQLTHIAPTQNK